MKQDISHTKVIMPKDEITLPRRTSYNRLKVYSHTAKVICCFFYLTMIVACIAAICHLSCLLKRRPHVISASAPRSIGNLEDHLMQVEQDMDAFAKTIKETRREVKASMLLELYSLPKIELLLLRSKAQLAAMEKVLNKSENLLLQSQSMVQSQSSPITTDNPGRRNPEATKTDSLAQENDEAGTKEKMAKKNMTKKTLKENEEMPVQTDSGKLFRKMHAVLDSVKKAFSNIF